MMRSVKATPKIVYRKGAGFADGRWRIFVVVLLAVLVAAWGRVALAQSPEPPPEPDAASTAEAPDGEEGGPTPIPTWTSVLDVVPTRTPEPTATPGLIEREVTKLAVQAGIATSTFLGLSVVDWVSLIVSVLWVILGYLLGTWLIKAVLPRAVRRTPIAFDDRLLGLISNEIRWLVVLLVLQLSTGRLTFLHADLKSILKDVYFILMLALVFRILWRLINRVADWYRAKAAREGREEQLAPIITILVRLTQTVVVVIGSSILLSHFGINVTAFAAVLGIGGLAFSLAAKGVIADAIDGFIILIDQPFRIGDRIEIQGVGTWGDVVDIGLRTTRIRTRDNRMVIVPNSIIGANQVINYSYPDPRYRIQTHVSVAYGSDIEKVRRIIIETVRRVEGVLADEPVDALYHEMGESAMIFRVRWWIESYTDTRHMFDRVHTALQNALDAAGVDMPYPTQTVNVHLEPEAVGQINAVLTRTESQ